MGVQRIAGLLLLTPVLVAGLAGPAYAASSTPLPDEPPGGATCAPGSTTDCLPETSSPTPSPTPSPTGPATLPRTGGTPTTLPRTGPEQAVPLGLAGAATLTLGLVLVATTRRAPRRAMTGTPRNGT